ncbi:outer membrane beta-barrel protein [Aurantibacillus circumpalustris]|uniref:outer membrane beta-barrel protein n=1 Tax=Aurantibacillus circumpalustris TaxID=3036359 RepID=UPI00295B35FF|nr:outer membrane beta-barrel protein [Aurantibacillus circumpalustris]
MKPILICFFTLVLVSSEAQVLIKGSVIDSLSNPVSFCAVGLLAKADSSIYKGNLTDVIGSFVFEKIPKGIYLIKIDHVGFAPTWSDPIEVDSINNVALNPVQLKSSGIDLKEVGIVTIKDPLEFKNGNITVNIEGSPLAIGNSVYDLLSRLPGVSVENDVISIQGKAGAKLYMDDRPQQLSGAQLINLLKSMNASSVEKIEVINNPPAKYDASGNAGIINIRTKKIKLVGFSGSFNATYSQGFYEKTNGALSLNYKGRRFNFFSNISGNQGVTHQLNRFDKSVTYNSETTQINQLIIDNYDNRTLTFDFGADWYLNKKNIIGCKLSFMPGYGNNDVSGTTNFSNNTEGYDRLILKKTLPNYWYYSNYNINAEHLFDTVGTKLIFSTDYYGPYVDVYEGNFQNRFLDSLDQPSLPAKDFTSNNTINFNYLTSKLDFEKKLTKTIDLETGVKGSFQDVQSDYIFQNKNNLTNEFVTDSTYTNKFRYLEKIGAGYFNLSKAFKKINLQLGLRAENTQIETQSIETSLSYHRNYFNLFPVLSIDYNRSKNHTFSLAYNKRIDRPNYNNFNPYKSFVNILTSSTGNPFINPSYSHNINFNYVYKSTVYNSLSLTHIQSNIVGYPMQNDSTKETTWITANLNGFDILRYSFFVRKNVTKRWTVSFNFGTYYISYTGKINGQNYSTSAIPHYEWLNNTFLLPKNTKFELTAYYWSAWLGIGNKYKGRGAASAALKKSFLENKLNISIGINDIFFTEVFLSTADFQNQKWESFDSSDTRRLNISISFNFGKIKVEQRDVKAENEGKVLGK